MEDRHKKRVTAIVFFTVFLDLIGFGIIIPLLPFYVESMGGTGVVVGFLLASFAFAQLVATPMLGRLSDRVGRRPVILLSLAGNALSMVLFAYGSHIHSLALLFVSRIFAGFTSGNLSACQAALSDVVDPKDRSRAMGKLGAGIGLGMALGPVIGSTLNHYASWAPPLAAAAMAVIDLIAALILMPETRQANLVDTTPGKKYLWTALSNRNVAIVLALNFLTFIGITNLQVALGLLSKARLNWGPSEVGNLFGLFGAITLIVQGGLIGWISSKIDEVRLVMLGSFCIAIGLGAIALSHQAFGLVAGLVVMSVGVAVVNPTVASLAARFAPTGRRGEILGFTQSAGGLARTVGPVWSGFLYSKVAPGAPFAAGAVTALVALLLVSKLKGEPSPR